MSRPFVLPFVLSFLALGLGLAEPALAGWNAASFAEADTIELLTVNDEGEAHWSTVWVVVIDEGVYVRLGNRAAGRIEGNATAPILKIRLGDEVVENVRGEPAPDMAERVGAAMADKYWTDLFIRFFPHPLTLRLVPGDA